MPDTISSRRPARRATLALGLVALLGLAAAAPAFAQGKTTVPPPSGSPEVKEKGTAPSVAPTSGLGRWLVGDIAPDVNLNDASGAAFHLASERRAKPWLLVFVRRPQETADVDGSADELNALGIGTVVIAPFGIEKEKEWVASPKLRLLFDRASVTARTYGLYDAVTSNPRPGAFLVDQRGRILWMVSGGLPVGHELVRMTREALEAAEAKPTAVEAEK